MIREAWDNVKASTPELMKFKRLQRRLGISVAQLCGHLELLWLATAKNAPEGDIGRFSNEDIAIACYWEDCPDVFVDALVECGWLDASEEWRLLVHDWATHAPTWVGGNLKRHGRNFHIPTSQPTRQPAIDESQPTKQPTKEVTKEATRQPTSDATTLPSQAKPSQVNTHTHTLGEDDFVVQSLSEELRPLWVKWLEVFFLKTGQRMPAPQQESNAMELGRRGANAVADLDFTIQKGAKSLLRATDDWQAIRAAAERSKIRESAKPKTVKSWESV